jgi:predicted nuclease with RNAse H fold
MPFRLPKIGKAEKKQRKKLSGKARVLPPKPQAREELTIRVVKLNTLIAEKGYKTMGLHPTSTRKALNMPTEDWSKIQTILEEMGLKGTFEQHEVTPHEVDASILALTAKLYLQEQTETIGNEDEGT